MKSELKPNDYEESIVVYKLLYDYSLLRYNKQHDHFDSLDTKASNLAGFIAVIITIISSFIGFVFTLQASNPNECISLIIITKSLFILLLLTLVCSLLCSLYGLRIRKVKDPSSIQSLMKYYTDLKKIDNIYKREKQLLFGLIQTLSRSEETLILENARKSQNIKFSSGLLMIALLFGILEIVSLILFYNFIK